MPDGIDDSTVIDAPEQERIDGEDATHATDTAPAADDDGAAQEQTSGSAEPVDSATEPSEASDTSDDDDDAGADDDGDDDDGDDEDDDESSDPLDVEGEVAADYLEELLDIADLDGDIDTYVENGRAHVSVITDSTSLVGSDGEVLEALQELARLAVITETGNRSRLMLDVGGYREQRRKDLTALAADAVEDVKANGESVRLKPMNPFERKIVHDVVAEAGLTSESEGEEPQRRVVVLPAN